VSITGDGLIIMTMLMIAGRLLPFAVLYAMISDRPNPSISDQPRYMARHIVDN
jgi:hypothetical protein